MNRVALETADPAVLGECHGCLLRTWSIRPSPPPTWRWPRSCIISADARFWINSKKKK